MGSAPVCVCRRRTLSACSHKKKGAIKVMKSKQVTSNLCFSLTSGKMEGFCNPKVIFFILVLISEGISQWQGCEKQAGPLKKQCFKQAKCGSEKKQANLTPQKCSVGSVSYFLAALRLAVRRSGKAQDCEPILQAIWPRLSAKFSSSSAV